MITVRPATARGLRCAAQILLLCSVQCPHAVAASPRAARIASPGVHAGQGEARLTDLKFTHLTTNDGLSQGYVVDILQDRRGFMWFATRDGLNRYDGYTFVVYKHDPNDPSSLSSNFIQDLMEDDRGYLWVATNTGVNGFDPTTERCTRYLHDPDDPGTLGGASVKSVAQDRHGYLWFGTEDGGLDRLDPRLGTFTHHRTDSEVTSDDSRLHYTFATWASTRCLHEQAPNQREVVAGACCGRRSPTAYLQSLRRHRLSPA